MFDYTTLKVLDNYGETSPVYGTGVFPSELPYESTRDYATHVSHMSWLFFHMNGGHSALGTRNTMAADSWAYIRPEHAKLSAKEQEALLNASDYDRGLCAAFNILEKPSAEDLPVLIVLTAKQIGNILEAGSGPSAQLFTLQAQHLYAKFGFRLAGVAKNRGYPEKTPNYIFVSERLRPKGRPQGSVLASKYLLYGVTDRKAAAYNETHSCLLSCCFSHPINCAHLNHLWVDHTPGQYSYVNATLYHREAGHPDLEMLSASMSDPEVQRIGQRHLYTALCGSELWLRNSYNITGPTHKRSPTPSGILGPEELAAFWTPEEAA